MRRSDRPSRCLSRASRLSSEPTRAVRSVSKPRERSNRPIRLHIDNFNLRYCPRRLRVGLSSGRTRRIARKSMSVPALRAAPKKYPLHGFTAVAPLKRWRLARSAAETRAATGVRVARRRYRRPSAPISHRFLADPPRSSRSGRRPRSAVRTLSRPLPHEGRSTKPSRANS